MFRRLYVASCWELDGSGELSNCQWLLMSRLRVKRLRVNQNDFSLLSFNIVMDEDPFDVHQIRRTRVARSNLCVKLVLVSFHPN